eukprot:GHUV01019168.1.p1 GENE.GHUV01019168.1~~GHUV01019168.1.p1  ORF type:complete len:141 (+),score=14.98 GHUV01019168.1:966-1388(+)
MLLSVRGNLTDNPACCCLLLPFQSCTSAAATVSSRAGTPVLPSQLRSPACKCLLLLFQPDVSHDLEDSSDGHHLWWYNLWLRFVPLGLFIGAPDTMSSINQHGHHYVQNQHTYISLMHQNIQLTTLPVNAAAAITVLHLS